MIVKKSTNLLLEEIADARISYRYTIKSTKGDPRAQREIDKAFRRWHEVWGNLSPDLQCKHIQYTPPVNPHTATNDGTEGRITAIIIEKTAMITEYGA